jgi:nitrate reductase NapAB chaperone NapD
MTDSRLRRFPTGGKRGSATLCVPVAHFDEAVDGVRGLAKVVSLSLGTDELTGEIADREAQISNENREEVAVAMVLSRVDRLDEVVGLQRNLARIRGRVARHSGELRAMRSQSELAAVEVRLHEPTGALALVSSGASSASYVNNAAGLLRTMGEVLLAVLIYLIMVGGVVLVPALVAWWFLVARRRRDGSLAGPEEKRGDGAGRPAAGLGHDERDRRKALGLESPPAK